MLPSNGLESREKEYLGTGGEENPGWTSKLGHISL